MDVHLWCIRLVKDMILMNNKAKKEKYSKLSIASLILGILPILFLCFYFLNIFVSNIIEFQTGIYWLNYGIMSLVAIGAIACGAIGLNKLGAGHFSRKSRRMNITAIVLGVSYFLILVLVFLGAFISFIFSPNL